MDWLIAFPNRLDEDTFQTLLDAWVDVYKAAGDDAHPERFLRLVHARNYPRFREYLDLCLKQRRWTFRYAAEPTPAPGRLIRGYVHLLESFDVPTPMREQIMNELDDHPGWHSLSPRRSQPPAAPPCDTQRKVELQTGALSSNTSACHTLGLPYSSCSGCAAA